MQILKERTNVKTTSSFESQSIKSNYGFKIYSHQLLFILSFKLLY